MGMQRTSKGWNIRKSLLGKEEVLLAKGEATWNKNILLEPVTICSQGCCEQVIPSK